MAGRLEARFGRLAREQRCGLVAYITAGEPAPDDAVSLWLQLARAGADILEIGLPADAWLDGPAIQAAHRRAKARGVDAAATLAAVAAFRVRDADTPLVLMGYGETLRSYGIEALARDAARAGADGALFIATAPDEARSLDAAMAAEGLAAIRVAFGEEERAWRAAVEGARGFVYVPAATGATGGADPTIETAAARLARIRELTPLPLVSGFGVRTPETFAALAPHADALAVGSAFAREIEAGLGADGRPGAALAGRVCALARRLVAAGAGRRSQ
jgi:tryptophan synthase alpha chain